MRDREFWIGIGHEAWGMIADFRLLSVAVLWLCVRSINQSIKSFRYIDPSKTLPLPHSGQSVNETDLKLLIAAKLSITPKHNHTSQTMIITHFFIASSLYAIPCSLYFVSLNSFSNIPFSSEHCLPTLSVPNARNRPIPTFLCMQKLLRKMLT